MRQCAFFLAFIVGTALCCPWAKAEEPSWSDAVGGLRCRLVNRGSEGARELVFEIKNESTARLVLPAWAEDKRFLALDVRLTGHPEVESPPVHAEASGAVIFLESDEVFSMSVRDCYVLGYGRLQETLLKPAHLPPGEYELSVAYENAEPTMGIADEDVPCWTGRLQSGPVTVTLDGKPKLGPSPWYDDPVAGHEAEPVESGWSEPSDGLVMKLRCSKGLYDVGDDVEVEAVLKNVSKKPAKVFVAGAGNDAAWNFFLDVRATRKGPFYRDLRGREGEGRMIDIAPGQEASVGVPLSRFLVAGPSHFYRPVGQEPLTLTIRGGVFPPVGITFFEDVWVGGMKAGPIVIRIQDPKATPLPAGVIPWPAALGRARARAELAAGVKRLLEAESRLQAHRQVDTRTELKIEAEKDAIWTMAFEHEVAAYNKAMKEAVGQEGDR